MIEFIEDTEDEAKETRTMFLYKRAPHHYVNQLQGGITAALEHFDKLEAKETGRIRGQKKLRREIEPID